MNERGAREVALVRAIETTDREQRLLGAEDRAQAHRSARDFSRWRASEHGASAGFEAFLQKRAALLLDRVGARHPALAALRHPGRWHVWAGILAPAIALLSGAAAERIANPQRVDLLSGALLLIVAWNLVVYLGLLLWPLITRRRSAAHDRATAAAGGLPAIVAHWLAAPRAKAKAAGGEAGAAALAFARDWARARTALTTARVARIMHLAAALFALGAIVSLYLRGITAEYRVGWESTFLDANQVHALLSWVFWPIIELSGMQPFSPDEVAALQFGHQQALPPGSGARWVHLYAALLTLVVIVPRLLLAGWAGFNERRLARSFNPDLNEPYFRRLLAGVGSAGAGAILRVLPYSFTLDERREQGLREVAAQLLGDDARLALHPSIGYGGEADGSPFSASAGTSAADATAEPALTLLLFSLAATPEKENHGAFLDQAIAALPRRSAVLVDESPLVERLGRGTATSLPRLAQRRELWRRFCELHGLRVAFVDLLHPSLSGIEHDLGPSVATPATSVS